MKGWRVAAKKLEQATDELYGLPLAEFTKARDDLAKRLRKEGKGDEADAVKALRKPTAAAAALNQLARRRPKDIKQLLATGKRLRKAHEALIGGGDRSALQAASAEERELIDSLASDAQTSAALEERIRDTLHAAALDEQTAAELAAGRLTHEREAVGFGAPSSGAPAPAKPTAKAAAPRRKAPGPRARPRETPRRRNRRPSASTNARSRPPSGRASAQTRRRGEPTRLAPPCAKPSSTSETQPRQRTARSAPSMQLKKKLG